MHPIQMKWWNSWARVLGQCFSGNSSSSADHFWLQLYFRSYNPIKGCDMLPLIGLGVREQQRFQKPGDQVALEKHSS